MNGAEHYVEAERLLKLAAQCFHAEEAQALGAQAVAHATLALIAGVMAPLSPHASMATLAELVTE